ncbi:hypothetical protein SNE40_008159 [Patella caerulea]|uniref:SOCS box domain-containing protein n=1 Tax=Patella caerulea TaxID=87958 RepID=A0AAN8K526_PATCE
MPTFLDEEYLLFEAAKFGKEDKIRTLISNGCRANTCDGQGRTALHWAAEYGYLSTVCLLIDSGWEINKQDHKGQTPLLIACNCRREDVAICLLKLGIDVNTCDVNGNTALHRAVHLNLESLTLLLIDAGCDISVHNDSNWTSLHEAARVGNENIIRTLLQRGAQVNTVTKNNMSPFLCAIFYYKIAPRNTYQCLDTILKMFIDSGCQLSQGDKQTTPFSACINMDNSCIAALLLFHGSVVERKGKFSKSILVEAFTRCEPFVTKLLVMSGYQVWPEEVDQCSRRIPAFSRSFLRLAAPDIDTGRGRNELIPWLRHRSQNPFSLLELSRHAVRVGLNIGTGDTSIINSINFLPIPTFLKNFVALDDFASSLTT